MIYALRVGLLIVAGALIALKILSLDADYEVLRIPYFGYLFTLVLLAALWTFCSNPEGGGEKRRASGVAVAIACFTLGAVAYMVSLGAAFLVAGPTGIEWANSYAFLLIAGGAVCSFPLLRKWLRKQ